MIKQEERWIRLGLKKKSNTIIEIKDTTWANEPEGTGEEGWLKRYQDSIKQYI